MQGKGRNSTARLGLLGLSLLILFCLSAGARSAPLVLLSEDSAIYREVGTAIENAYTGPVMRHTSDSLPSTAPLGSDLAIAVGSRACEQMLQRGSEDFALVCAFVPRATFDALVGRYGSTDLVTQQRLSAIYLDQPLERHLRLVRLLVPEAKSIGAMFGPVSLAERDRFLSAAEAEQLSPVSITLGESDNPIAKLQPVVRRSDVFLALPDSALFNRATAKWLLYVTLRQQVPVIGFSRTYVEAGALAAVYSTPAQIGRQAGELLRQLDAGEPLPPPAFPRYFTVSSNPVVARTLGLEVPDDGSLAKRLE